MLDIDGVVKLVPVPKALPPLDAAYQLIVPVPAADKLTVPVPQRLPSVVELKVGRAVTVAVTAVLLALVHDPLTISA